MLSTIQTRSSQRRPKRNIKPSRCLDNCESCYHTKRKGAHNPNQQNSTSPTKGKKLTTTKKKEKRISASKKNEKLVVHNGNGVARETKGQLAKYPIVVLTPLPLVNIGNKEETNKKMNKNSAKVNENKEKQKSQNEKVNTNIKTPALRTRKRTYQNKGKPNQNSPRPNTNKHAAPEKRPSPKINNNQSQVLNSNTINKQKEIFKKPPLITREPKSQNTVLSPLLLRSRRVMDYAESSLDSSTESEKKPNDVDRVPIYQKPFAGDNKKKKRPINDLYEFDESDSENTKKKKKRRGATSSPEEYDRTIRNILRNVVNKVRKRKKKAIYSDAKNNNEKKAKQIKFAPLTNNITKDKCDFKENKATIAQTRIENKLEQEKDKTVQQNQPLEFPDDDMDDNGEFFGFETDKIAPNNTPKVKILSNIHLQPDKELNLSIASPASFNNRPKANSTMLNNVFSPWRFNEINIRRNPHFLEIKQSSLPSISQETVLDHTMVDKFENSSKTPLRSTIKSPSNKKTPGQTYLTDYFTDKDELENKENTNISLYDENLLSPIKNNFSNRVNQIRRKILCEKDDNIKIQPSTPRGNETHAILDHLNSKTPEDIHTNFGFSSDEEEDGEMTPKKNKEDKPFRVSINVNDKKYTRRRLKKPVKSSPVRPVLQSDEDSDEKSDWSDAESHNGEVRLFDDLNDTEDNLKDPKVTKKKTKLKWLNDDNQKPKKRKDVRTKEEEEQAEKWAAAFNSMCEEIEDFPLEIE